MNLWVEKFLNDVIKGRQAHYLKSAGRLFMIPFFWALILYMKKVTNDGYFGLMVLLWIFNIGLSLIGMKKTLPKNVLLKHMGAVLVLVALLCGLVSLITINYGLLFGAGAGILIYLAWLVSAYPSWERIRREIEERKSKTNQKRKTKNSIRRK